MQDQAINKSVVQGSSAVSAMGAGDSNIFDKDVERNQAGEPNSTHNNSQDVNFEKSAKSVNNGDMGNNLNNSKSSISDGTENTTDQPYNKNPNHKVKEPKVKDDRSFIQKLNSWLKAKFCSETEVIGVEIQPDIIRVCKAKKDNDSWKVEKLAYENVLESFDFEVIEKNKDLYAKTLKSIFKKNRFGNKNIALSIPASLTIIKTISLPSMTEENLGKASNIPSFWQNLVQLSGNINDYVIFYKIISTNQEKKEMEVLFVGCKKEDLDIFLDIAKKAELNTVVVDIACFSINNLYKLKENSESEKQVYLKIGRDENYLQVVENGIPDIYDIFVPENEKAYLNEYLDHQNFQQKFTSQLKHVISKYEDKSDLKIEKISVLSNEANINAFVDSLNQNIDNIRVDLADLFSGIKLPDKIKKLDKFEENPTAWAVSSGLATRNINIFEEKNNQNISETINLLPRASEIMKALKSAFYSKIIVGSSFIICLLLILAFSAFSYGRYYTKMAEIKEFNSLNQAYKKQQDEFNAINRKSGSLNKLIKTKEAIKDNQIKIINSLNDISGNIPEGVWLEDIKTDVNDKIFITGKAYEEKNIIRFSKNLEQAETIETININNIKTGYLESGAMIREFSLQGKIK